MAEINSCAIIAGAPHPDMEFLRQQLSYEKVIICADAGYITAEQCGFMPDIIVADFDSAPLPDLPCEIVKAPIEKDATDTFNAVKLAVERGFQSITIYNALGGRFDHSYANLLCLHYCLQQGVACTISERNQRLSLIADRKTFKKEYSAFSLFAFLEDCYGVQIQGAHYDASFFGKETLDILMSEQFAQSNYIEHESCTVSLEKGILLLIESNDFA